MKSVTRLLIFVFPLSHRMKEHTKQMILSFILNSYTLIIKLYQSLKAHLRYSLLKALIFYFHPNNLFFPTNQQYFVSCLVYVSCLPLPRIKFVCVCFITSIILKYSILFKISFKYFLDLVLSFWIASLRKIDKLLCSVEIIF